jgi:hypothetical protein
MKTWLPCFLLGLLILPIRAADPSDKTLDGFLEVPWGADAETLKKQLASRTRATFEKARSEEGRLHFKEGKFAGFKFHYMEAFLEQGQFQRAAVHLEEFNKDREKEFATFLKLLTDKYGPPTENEVKGNKHDASWIFKVEGGQANRIELHNAPGEPGLKLNYGSPSTRINALRAAASAKDDL